MARSKRSTSWVFLTETAQKADVVLPAVSWAEGDGTFTNVERRVQRAPKALDNPENKSAPDWMILDHLASMMGHQWSYENAQSITEEISQVVPIYNGLDWASLGDQGLQWDAAAARPEADYLPVEQLPMDEADEDALALVTGTVTYDDGTMFALTEVMERMRFGANVGLNPADIARLNLAEGQVVTVQSSQGNLNLQVKVAEQVRAGTMDWMTYVVFPFIRAALLAIILLTSFAYLTWVERKLLARFQIRYGPNRAGPFGLLQPAADALKAFFKEEVIPNHVDKPLYVLAPALALIPALVVWAVIPVAKGVPAIADVGIGFLWILAITGIESYGIILAGWSSNNNYSGRRL